MASSWVELTVAICKGFRRHTKANVHMFVLHIYYNCDFEIVNLSKFFFLNVNIVDVRQTGTPGRMVLHYLSIGTSAAGLTGWIRLSRAYGLKHSQGPFPINGPGCRPTLAWRSRCFLGALSAHPLFYCLSGFCSRDFFTRSLVRPCTV